MLVKANLSFEQHDGHSISRAVCLLILTTPHKTMIAIGLISHIICITELQDKPKVTCTKLLRLIWVLSSRFIPNFVIFSDHYMMLTYKWMSHKRGSLTAGFITYFTQLCKNNLHFPHINTTYIYLPYSYRGKVLISLQIVFWMSQQLFRTNFLLVARSVCPQRTPEVFAH